MAGIGVALGPLIVAADLEEFEEELTMFLARHVPTIDGERILERYRIRRRRAQRVAHRVRIAESWFRGDGEEAGRSTRDLERDYAETYSVAD